MNMRNVRNAVLMLSLTAGSVCFAIRPWPSAWVKDFLTADPFSGIEESKALDDNEIDLTIEQISAAAQKLQSYANQLKRESLAAQQEILNQALDQKSKAAGGLKKLKKHIHAQNRATQQQAANDAICSVDTQVVDGKYVVKIKLPDVQKEDITLKLTSDESARGARKSVTVSAMTTAAKKRAAAAPSTNGVQSYSMVQTSYSSTSRGRQDIINDNGNIKAEIGLPASAQLDAEKLQKSMEFKDGLLTLTFALEQKAQPQETVIRFAPDKEAKKAEK